MDCPSRWSVLKRKVVYTCVCLQKRRIRFRHNKSLHHTSDSPSLCIFFSSYYSGFGGVDLKETKGV